MVVGKDAADEDMRGTSVGRADELGSDDQETVAALASTEAEKTDFLAAYQMMSDPLRTLEKTRSTLHELLKRLAAVDRLEGPVGMASLHRGVVEIEAEERGGALSEAGVGDPMEEISGEVRALH